MCVYILSIEFSIYMHAHSKFIIWHITYSYMVQRHYNTRNFVACLWKYLTSHIWQVYVCSIFSFIIYAYAIISHHFQSIVCFLFSLDLQVQMCGWMYFLYNYHISMLSYTHVYSGAIMFRINRGLKSSQVGVECGLREHGNILSCHRSKEGK